MTVKFGQVTLVSTVPVELWGRNLFGVRTFGEKVETVAVDHSLEKC